MEFFEGEEDIGMWMRAADPVRLLHDGVKSRDVFGGLELRLGSYGTMR